MRARRERAARSRPVALAGYTNAGKSTLLNALTGAGRRGGGEALPHARPDDPRLRARRPPLPRHRHGRLHPEAAPPARRGVQGDARGDGPRRPDPARGRRLRAGGSGAEQAIAAVDAVLEEIGAGRRRRACSSSTRSTCSTRTSAASCAIANPGRGRRSRPLTGEGLDELRDADRGGVRGDPAPGRAAGPLRRAAPPVRAARAGRRPRARGPRRGRARPGAGPGGRAAAPLRRTSTAERHPPASPTLDLELRFAGSRRTARGCPTRAHDGDAGLDLYAAEAARHRARRARGSVGTGVAVEIPDGHAGLVLPRSGLAREHGIALVNAPGPDRLRLPRRGPGPAAQHRPGRALRGRARRPHRPAAARPFAAAEPVEADELAETARGAAASARAAAESRRSPSMSPRRRLRAVRSASPRWRTRARPPRARRRAARARGSCAVAARERERRSGGRRARRSWAAAGRAGRCRSGWPAHALEAVRAVVAVPAGHAAERLGARRRGRCGRRGSRSRRARAAAAEVDLDRDVADQPWARARAPSRGRRGRGPGSAPRRAGSCGRAAGSRRRRRARRRRPRPRRRGRARLRRDHVGGDQRAGRGPGRRRCRSGRGRRGRSASPGPAAA